MEGNCRAKFCNVTTNSYTRHRCHNWIYVFPSEKLSITNISFKYKITCICAKINGCLGRAIWEIPKHLQNKGLLPSPEMLPLKVCFIRHCPLLRYGFSLAACAISYKTMASNTQRCWCLPNKWLQWREFLWRRRIKQKSSDPSPLHKGEPTWIGDSEQP